MNTLMHRLLILGVTAIVCYGNPGNCYALEVFSAGLLVPETISQVPTGFGAFEGDYLVPDPGEAFVGPMRIWAVPAGGGTPTVFVDAAALNDDELLPVIG